MAVRPSMNVLIARVRNLIADPAGASQQFDDQTIQDVLDSSRTVVRYAELRLEPTLAVGGILNYSDYYSNITDWEDSPGTQVYGPNYALLSPAESDTTTGHWRFALPNPGQVPPVFVVGAYYDVYCAAADLCERWAAFLARDYDFSTGNQKFSRSQAMRGMLALADQYRMQAAPVSKGIHREDTNNTTGTTLDKWIGY